MSTQLPATKKTNTLRDLLTSDKVKAQFAAALPKHIKPDRFVRIAITALTRTPKLQQCTQESFFQCLVDLSALGLEPDNQRAYLIPFDNRKLGVTVCTLIVGYKGLVDLVRRSGEVADIHADVVYSGDQFDYMFGTGSFLKHKPALKDRGEPICAYSYVRLKDGSETFDLMSANDIEAIRAKSRSKDDGPWVTSWNEMAKKTVFRRHAKWLPFSSELREAVEKDDEPLTENERFAAAKPATITEDISFLSAPQEPEPVAEKESEKVEVKA